MIQNYAPPPTLFEGLEKTLDIMQKVYEKKMRHAKSNMEINLYTNKLIFIQDMRLLLYVHKDTNRFIEDLEK